MDANLPIYPAIDRDYCEGVEKEIAQSLERATELESALDEVPAETKNSWFDALDHLNASLATWQKRLAELTDRTAAAEGELAEQEQSLRTWLQTMRSTSTRLAQASETTAA